LLFPLLPILWFSMTICFDVLFTSSYLLHWAESWIANRFSAGQEIPRILWNPKIHYRIHKCSPTVPILSQLDPAHTLTSHFLKIHLNIILPPTTGSPKWSLSFRPGVLFTFRYHRNRFHQVTPNRSFPTSVRTLMVSPFSLISLRIFFKNTSQFQVANEPVVCLVSMFLRCWNYYLIQKFLERLFGCQFVKKNCAPWNYCTLNLLYTVIHKSPRDFRPLCYSTRDGHAEGEHINR
jgi:hypothetical protein